MPEFRIRIVADPKGVGPGARVVEQRLARVEQRANRLRNSIGRLFGVLGSVEVLRRTIGLYANFDQRLSSVQAVSGATRGEIKLLREETERLGASTRFSAIQAAEAAETLSRAGFSVNEVIGVLPGTLQLAQAGALGLNQAAGITTATLKSFGLEVDNTTRVVDVLAKGAATAFTDVSQLGQAVSFVGPIAKAANIELEETVALIQVLSNAGIQATRAGTGLRTVLGILQAPTAELANALRDANLELTDVDPRANKLADVFRRLEAAGLGAGRGVDLFTKRGATAFEVLVANIDQIEKFEKELKNAGGTAAELARIQDDNLKGALLETRSAIEAVVLALGGTQDSRLTGFFRGLASLFRSVAANVDVLVDVLEGLAVVLGARLAQSAIGLALAGFNRLKALFLVTAKNATVLNRTLAITVGLTRVLGGGILLAGAATVALADKIKIADDSTSTLADVFDRLTAAIGEGLGPTLAITERQLGELFGREFKLNLENLLVTAAEIFDKIVGVVRGAVLAIVDGFSLGTRTIGLLFTNLRLSLQVTFQNILNSASKLGQSLIKTLATPLLAVVDGFANVVAGAAAVGAVSEKTRIKVESGVAKLENTIKQIRDGEPVELFNVRATEQALERNTAQAEGALKSFGVTLKAAFLEGFEQETFAPLIRAIIAESKAGAREAAEQAAQAAFQVLGRVGRFVQAAAGIGSLAGAGGASRDAEAVLNEASADRADRIAKEAIGLRDQIDLTAQLAVEERLLNDIISGRVNASEEAKTAATLALEELRLTALDASTTIGAGFERTFIRIRQEARDFATVVESSLNTLVSRGSDALAQFVRTGTFNFRNFANSVLDDLARIFARLLLIQGINAAAGFLGVPGAGAAVPFSFGGARQFGGPVSPGSSFLVGERNAERFVPDRPGRIEPDAGEVTIVNVDDEERVQDHMATARGGRVVVNQVRANRKVTRRTLS